MEKRAARLAPVVDMASKAERDAATQLGRSQQQLLAAQQKLAELERYRNDYQQQWISQGQKGVSGQWLMNYQRFLSQLETAVAQQANSVTWHREAVDKARLNWQERYARLEGLRKLVERYLEEARQAEDKREQKQLDELAQRTRRQDD
ncbi:flagellar export protein FliJ [Pseudomonas aeruginosa]|uniref:flagellar export protein FliJ n=1 Tax=Pseudomonas aeruginosa TaxID=287 RepID=UPI00053EBCD4|nr:flagellar export protein FliJ [Pseudomonas aeruginosa]ELI9043329.1 flagella biosynthesis chaperone FliJ [Pseudomonas aeruginosa]ELK4874563.1 flagella biosynthesis chaperone FliJ [Pseudomonas aeruginosa]ELK4876132.1 flagella biosynthesis chaperone FliJ [Pseudomonas aeruginosa]KSQ03525.1 flagellar protein FliJ [Pseudomonas aeruginosa]MBG4153227.1 flagella biosynthesis chaperone FliJ [Pseudomonas aeruginosa]